MGAERRGLRESKGGRGDRGEGRGEIRRERRGW
jgi:hypothetical protein